MGVSHSAAELNTKLKKAEKVVGDSGTRKSLLPVAKRVEGVMVRSAAQAGIHKGSKIAGKPWRGVYTRNIGSKELAVGYASPAHLVNTRTRAHIVGARKLGTRSAITKRVTGAHLVSALSGSHVLASFALKDSRRGAKALHWGSNFAAYVHVKGTRGKHFYERAIPVAKGEGADEYGHGITRGLSRVFA